MRAPPLRAVTGAGLALIAIIVATVAPALGRTALGSAAVAPEAGGWLGAYVNHADPPDLAAHMAEIAALEAALGRRLDIDHHYHEFSDPGGIVGPLETWDVASGRIPLVSWHGADAAGVAAGDHDAWIDSQAEAVAAVEAVVFIRWGWEMDSRRNVSWVISPERYVAAWRHLHDRFEAAGASNALWVWCPQAIGFTNGAAPAFYPGDAYVDWICADGYNWAPGRAGTAWRSFARVFESFYAWGRARGKPLMIAETGAQERGPGEKAAWIAEANRSLQEDFPAIKALVYFDSNARYDWRVITSPETFAAFKALACDPYWNQPLPAAAGGRPVPTPEESSPPIPQGREWHTGREALALAALAALMFLLVATRVLRRPRPSRGPTGR